MPSPPLTLGPARAATSRRAALVVHASPTGYELHDPDLARCLGDPDTRIPLPFTPDALPAAVCTHLRRLNPHREVRFAGAPQSPIHAPLGAIPPVP